MCLEFCYLFSLKKGGEGVIYGFMMVALLLVGLVSEISCMTIPLYQEQDTKTSLHTIFIC